MAKDPDQRDDQDDEGFGLVAPSNNLNDEADAQPVPVAEPEIQQAAVLNEEGEDDYGNMTWKGFEEEEDDPDPMVTFGGKSDREEDELDMTPMVDVTFLLLIFFMVTASFTLQKSIEQPPANVDDPSNNVIEDPEEEDDYVEIVIDQTNTYYVTSREEEQVECPSDREMRARLRDAKNLAGATRLIIRAHVDSQLKKQVTAWDAGIAVGMDRIEVKTTDEDF